MATDAGHWADRAVDALLETGTTHVLNTGITPSGPIHVGNMREVLTADAVCRGLADRDAAPTFFYMADTYDPLRRVYPFLPDEFEAHVGRPLSEIPCPCGAHESYAIHFLEPFTASLERLGIGARVVQAHELYRDGWYRQAIGLALDHRDTIARIIHEETGRALADDWSPFNPQCSACRRLTTTTCVGHSAADETAAYRCECGHEGDAAFAGGGKLTWRVDWPARWWILGVTFEPFGKDHASRGGSFDTGRRIAEEVFRFDPPQHVVYEWIGLKGAGDMSSSRGNVLTIEEMLEVVPPEILRYLVMSRAPARRITFDPGRPLLSLVSTFDREAAVDPPPRAVQLSCVGALTPSSVPYDHLVTVTQIVRDDDDALVDVLRRGGYDTGDRAALLGRAACARRWVEKFAPAEMVFELQERVPPDARSLSSGQRAGLRALADRLTPEATATEIHQHVYDAAAEAGIETPELFTAVYVSLLGRQRGPRAGSFLASLDRDFVRKRFRTVGADAE